MARQYRIQGENLFYHITSRGNNKQEIFRDDADREKFLFYINKAKEKYNFYLYAYVLMKNHYHLFIETLFPNLSQLMHYINSSYSTYYNIKYDLNGHVFQGRYKSLVVDNCNYFLKVVRYIHLNPVKAGLVASAVDYLWSSCKGYFSNGGDPFIDNDQIIKYLKLDDQRWLNFLTLGLDLDEDPFEDIYAGYLLGDENFINDKLNGITDKINNREISYRKSLSGKLICNDIINKIAIQYNKDPKDILNGRMESNQVRNIIIYILKNVTPLRNREIGQRFKISYSAVSKAAGIISQSINNDIKFKQEIENLISEFS
ncbi:MAG: transposase [Spirochaetes bacterium]|nr:transposase [Spirochaetota bacterium]